MFYTRKHILLYRRSRVGRAAAVPALHALRVVLSKDTINNKDASVVRATLTTLARTRPCRSKEYTGNPCPPCCNNNVNNSKDTTNNIRNNNDSSNSDQTMMYVYV